MTALIFTLDTGHPSVVEIDWRNQAITLKLPVEGEFERNRDVTPITMTAGVRFGYDLVPMHSQINTRYGRLKAIGAGFALAAVGGFRLQGGVHVVRTWTGQPMFSWGLIAAGIVCIISAFIPNSWVAIALGTAGTRTTSKKQPR